MGTPMISYGHWQGQTAHRTHEKCRRLRDEHIRNIKHNFPSDQVCRRSYSQNLRVNLEEKRITATGKTGSGYHPLAVRGEP